MGFAIFRLLSGICSPLALLYIASLPWSAAFAQPKEGGAVRIQQQAPPSRAEPDQEPVERGRVVLRDQSGAEAEVLLLRKSGDHVSIRRLADGSELVIPINILAKDSAAAVERWARLDPTAIDFSLGIEADSYVKDSQNYETTDRRELTTKNWSYDIRIQNRSREDLEGARVEYRIYYHDDVELRGVAGVPGKGRYQYIEGGADLPKMLFNDRVEFSTESLPLHTFDYHPYKPRMKMRREFAQDTLVGLWLRVMKKNAVLAEYQSDPAAMSELRWTTDKNSPIEVRDPFRERFGPR